MKIDIYVENATTFETVNKICLVKVNVLRRREG